MKNQNQKHIPPSPPSKGGAAFAIALLLGVGTLQNAHADTTDGLVAHWSFDDCKATDNSGNGHDGTLNGNPQCVDGVKGKAFSFDGNSSIKSSDYLNQIINDKTLVAWVKLNDLEQQKGGVVGIGTDLYVKDNFDSIVYGEWNKYHWLMGSTGFYRSSEASSFVENSKSWVLMAITYTNNNYKIYRNGELIGSTNEYKTSTFEKDSFFYVGKRAILDCSHAAKVCLNAVIDEARLYNRALTEAEVLELYSGAIQPKETVQISGQIKLGSQAGKDVALSGKGLTEECLTDVTGKFNCKITKNWTGFLTPELKGVTFLPPRISIADAKTDLIVKETIVGSKIEEPAFCELDAGSQADDYLAKTNSTDLNNQNLKSMENMPIDYVFVLMLENRSFDSYFGRLPAYLQKKGRKNDIRTKPFVDESNPDGIDVPGTPYDLLSKTEQQMADSDFTPNANTRNNAPYNLNFTNPETADPSKHFYWKHNSLSKQGKLGGGACVSDTAHDWWAVHLQWDNGKMDGFYQSNHNYWEGTSPNVGKPNIAKKTEPFLLNGERAMMYYDERDIPFYYWLADNFAIGDRYFSSVLGPTWVNRDYLYAGTSRGLTSNYSDYFYMDLNNKVDLALCATTGQCPNLTAGAEIANPAVQQINGKQINYITEALETKGKTVMYWLNDLSGKHDSFSDYYSDGGLKTPPKVGAWTGKAATSDSRVRSLDKGQYLMSRLSVNDAGFDAALTSETAEIKKSGVPFHSYVADVNFIDPKVLEDVNGEDEHPPSVPANGQRLTYKVVKALMSHPEIWKRSVLFITYDEHGGFYDHVSPPPACKPDNIKPKWSGRYGGSANALPQACLDANGNAIKNCSYLPDDTDKKYGGDFDRYGVRVPVMVVSPWVKPNFVSHRTYDHTSILRFIEGRFGLPALTKRDANADPMLDMFDFSALNPNLEKLKLPTAFNITVDKKTVNSVSNTANLVPAICKTATWFKSDPNSVYYGAKPYPPRDWSDGIAPPSSYDVNK